MDPFKILGEHEITIVVKNLYREDVVRLQLVNKNWRKILNSNSICKVAFLSHFPWNSEVAEYLRLTTEESKQDLREQDEVERATEHEDETDLPSGFNFTAAFRRALRQHMSLRSGKPQLEQRFFIATYTWDGAGSPTNEAIWGISDSIEPCFVAWVTNCALHIMQPSTEESHVPLPLPVFAGRLHLKNGSRTGIRKLEVKELKIMAGVVVLKAWGNITHRITGNYGVTTIFLAFTFRGHLLWEHFVPHLVLPDETLETIAPGHFDLVNRDGRCGLVYIARNNTYDRDGGVSIHWIDLFTGLRSSDIYLQLGIMNPQSHGPFSPLNWLWRDVKFSKDGRYLATVTLKEETKSMETRAKGEVDVLVPRGAHHHWGFNLILSKIKGRVYRVYVHDMQTGKLIMNHELERPFEPNDGNIKVEFSPKISFCSAKQTMHVIEETYTYIAHDIPPSEKATVESYGWEIELQPTTGAISENIKRTLYTSQLSENEFGPAEFKGPYRIETFIPSDNLSIIRYNNQTNDTNFDVGCYLAGADEVAQDGVEQATSLMWERNEVIERPTRKSAWQTPTMELSPSGSWQDALFISDRYLGVAPPHPLASKLTLLDFGSN